MKNKLSRPSWDKYFMAMAELAASRSTCIRRKVGAVLVKNRDDYNDELTDTVLYGLLEKFEGDADNCDNCKGSSCFSIDGARALHGFPSMSESLKSDIDAANAMIKGNIAEEPKDKDYRKESIVSKNKIKIDEMINAHWAYVESVIRTSNEHGLYMPPMTLEEALKIREFDYKTAAKHFYGHGHEDGVIDMTKTTAERLRK